MAMKTQNEKLDCHLKVIRQAKGFTQSQLAERVGVKRQAIFDIESGRYLPNTALALKLARCMGCRVEDLFVEKTAATAHPVSIVETTFVKSPRVALARVRDRLVAYPLTGKHALNEGFRAADGLLDPNSTAVRLLSSDDRIEKTILLLGCDPAFSLLQAHVSRIAPEIRIHCRFASSHRALEGLRNGHAHLAGTHLHNTGNDDSNARLAKTNRLGSKAILMAFSLFEEGLMVARGNPHNFRTVADLTHSRVRLINREPGAALRVLLDDYLTRAGIPVEAVRGYDNEVQDHYDGAQAVVNHTADAALGLRAVAEAFNLDFVPMETVRCDLVIPRDLMEHPPMKILLNAIQSRRLREELSMLPGYEASLTGKVVANL